MEVENTEKIGHVELNSENFNSNVLNNEKPAIVDFYADWCGPCRQFAPIFEEFAKKYGNKISFGKVNIDECGDLAEKYEVMSIPTVIFFEKGQEIKRHTGAMREDEFESAVNACFELEK